MLPNTICLKGDYLRKEGKCTVAVRPGMLVEPIPAGGTTIRPATKQGVGVAATPKWFALENDLVGKGVKAPVGSGEGFSYLPEGYAINDTVPYGVFQRGAQILALLKTGQNVAI